MSTGRVMVESAGRVVVLDGTTRRLGGHLTSLGRGYDRSLAASFPQVAVRVEAGRPPVPTDDAWSPVTRGVQRERATGRVRFDNVGGSGITQVWSREPDLRVDSWWDPGAKELAAASVLRSRQRLLEAQVLLHYPALVSAATEGSAPLHVSLLAVNGATVLLAGAGGIGKSTLVAGAVARGAAAWCDNVAASDGRRCFGLREQLRVPPEVAGGVSTGRTSHGRVALDHAFCSGGVEPDVVVVVSRDDRPEPTLDTCSPGRARRALLAGTFAAGELARLWPLTAALSLAWDDLPSLPEVERVAGDLCDRLPTFELTLGRRRGVPLEELLEPMVVDTERGVG